MALTDVDKQKFLDSITVGDSSGNDIVDSIPSPSTEFNVGVRGPSASQSSGDNFIELREGLTADEILRESGTPHPDSSPGFDSGNNSSGFTDSNVQPHVITMEEWLANGGISPFSFNTELSNEENLANICNWLNSVFSFYQYSGDQSAINFGNLLSYVYTTISNSPNNYMRNLSDAASLELSEKIVDITSAFINSQFNAAMSYQSWYLQQEYNSPLNQVNRLAEAGLNSAFVLGNLSSGNASSPASVGMIQSPSASNAGQAEESSHGSWLSFLGQGISSALSFIPGVGGAAAAVCSTMFEQFVGKKMLPYNIAKAGADVLNMGQSFLNLQTANDEIKANMALKEFESGKSSIEFEQNIAKSRVDSAKEYYDSIYNKYSQEYEELGYQVKVRTKDGKNENRVLTLDETTSVVSGNTTLSDGSVVVGVSTVDRLREANMNLNAGLSIPGGGSVGVSGGAHAADKDTETHSDTKSHNKTSSVGTSSTVGNKQEGYKLDGSSFTIGDTEFKSVTIRRRLPLPEYAKKIQKAQKTYEMLLDRYDTLTTGNKARLHLLQDKLTRNLSKLSSSVVAAKYKALMNKYIESKPEFLQGD